MGVTHRAVSASSAASTQPLAGEPRECSLPDHICLGAPKGSEWGIHEKNPEAACFLHLPPCGGGSSSPLQRCRRARALGHQSSHSVKEALVCGPQPADPSIPGDWGQRPEVMMLGRQKQTLNPVRVSGQMHGSCPGWPRSAASSRRPGGCHAQRRGVLLGCPLVGLVSVHKSGRGQGGSVIHNTSGVPSLRAGRRTSLCGAQPSCGPCAPLRLELGTGCCLLGVLFLLTG